MILHAMGKVQVLFYLLIIASLSNSVMFIYIFQFIMIDQFIYIFLNLFNIPVLNSLGSLCYETVKKNCTLPNYSFAQMAGKLFHYYLLNNPLLPSQVVCNVHLITHSFILKYVLIIWEFFKRLSIELPYSLENFTPKYTLKRSEKHPHKKTCT